jgi:hypothetical protein
MFEPVGYVHVGDASHWMEPFQILRKIAEASGFDLQTDDMVDLDVASALVMMEPPMDLRDVAMLKKKYPKLKIILQVLETPVGRMWTFDAKNHRGFDAVLTYNDRLRGERGYFIYKLPAGGLRSWESRSQGTSWEDRKLVCMVTRVPNPAPRFPRRSGVGMFRAGWRFTPRTWWNYVKEGGSLHRERLAIAFGLAKQLPGEFEIFGPGWDTLDEKEVIRAAWQGPWLGSKLELLDQYKFNIAYENCVNDVGYISEKIFDALLSGTVPVYLGNQSIQRYVPAGSFVDAREFKTVNELGAFLKGMPRKQWEEMREVGDDYLRNGAEEYFGAGQYADSVIESIKYVLQEIPAQS